MSSKAEINEKHKRRRRPYIGATAENPGKLRCTTEEISRIYKSKAVTEQGFKLYYKDLPSPNGWAWVCIRLTKDATKPVDMSLDTYNDKFLYSEPASKIREICLDIAYLCEKEGSVQ